MSKVLVIGAGASKAYGYPLGGELRQSIIDISGGMATRAGIVRERTELKDLRHLTAFQESFRHSQMYSIDAFLGRRPEFAEIGKKCIASILFGCEGSSALFDESDEKDHWYQYLFNQLAKSDWDELTFSDISIINFNYDRSLEHFLYVAIQSTYGKSAIDVRKKLKSLRMIHVYGSLCKELPDTDDYLKYDGKIDMEKVDAGAKGIVVIPEGRIDNPTLVDARKWLETATSICFLGFGFDGLNVERLAKDEACKRWKVFPSGHTARNIVGTCLGMTSAEIGVAVAKLTLESLPLGGQKQFRSVNCTQLLRETLFLA